MGLVESFVIKNCVKSSWNKVSESLASLWKKKSLTPSEGFYAYTYDKAKKDDNFSCHWCNVLVGAIVCIALLKKDIKSCENGSGNEYAFVMYM